MSKEERKKALLEHRTQTQRERRERRRAERVQKAQEQGIKLVGKGKNQRRQGKPPPGGTAGGRRAKKPANPQQGQNERDAPDTAEEAGQGQRTAGAAAPRRGRPPKAPAGGARHSQNSSTAEASAPRRGRPPKASTGGARQSQNSDDDVQASGACTKQKQGGRARNVTEPQRKGRTRKERRASTSSPEPPGGRKRPS